MKPLRSFKVTDYILKIYKMALKPLTVSWKLMCVSVKSKFLFVQYNNMLQASSFCLLQSMKNYSVVACEEFVPVFSPHSWLSTADEHNVQLHVQHFHLIKWYKPVHQCPKWDSCSPVRGHSDPPFLSGNPHQCIPSL